MTAAWFIIKLHNRYQEKKTNSRNTAWNASWRHIALLFSLPKKFCPNLIIALSSFWTTGTSEMNPAHKYIRRWEGNKTLVGNLTRNEKQRKQEIHLISTLKTFFWPFYLSHLWYHASGSHKTDRRNRN